MDLVASNDFFVVATVATFLDFIVGTLSILHLIYIGVVSCILCEDLLSGGEASISLATSTIGFLVVFAALGDSSSMSICLEVIPYTIYLNHLRNSIGSSVDAQQFFSS